MSEHQKDLYNKDEHHTRIFGINIQRLIPFIEMRWFSFFLSGAIIIAGLVMFFAKGGFNLGIDFKGGIKIELQINNADGNIANVRKFFSAEKIEAEINTVGTGADKHYMITLPVMPNSSSADEVTQIKDKLGKVFGADQVKVLGSEKVDAKMGADFTRKAINLILVTAALILLYVIFRFDFFYGSGAVTAMLHDVLMMLAFTVFFNIPIDITVIAAILTIIGYSVNDTIVVFDRIRELTKNNPNEDYKYIMDKSITQTLSRTIITSLTVFFVALALYLWGGVVLKNFSFLLVVGVIDGTYSSIFIAAPITYMARKAFDKNSKNSPKKAVPVSQGK